MKNMKNILKYALAAGIAAVMLASCDLDLVPTTSIAYTPGESPMLTATDGIDKWNFTASKPVTLSNGQYYQIQVQMMKEAGVYMGLFVGGASSGIPLLWARTKVLP